MKWEKLLINKSNQLLMLIPPGVGNAYYVSSPQAVYHYKLAYTGEYLDANNQFTRSWDHKGLNIDWPVKKPILSPRDSL
jgi:dTDP-4-dehydrorhamnose 3,5-epimerase